MRKQEALRVPLALLPARQRSPSAHQLAASLSLPGQNDAEPFLGAPTFTTEKRCAPFRLLPFLTQGSHSSSGCHHAVS